MSVWSFPASGRPIRRAVGADRGRFVVEANGSKGVYFQPPVETKKRFQHGVKLLSSTRTAALGAIQPDVDRETLKMHQRQVCASPPDCLRPTLGICQLRGGMGMGLVRRVVSSRCERLV